MPVGHDSHYSIIIKLSTLLGPVVINIVPFPSFFREQVSSPCIWYFLSGAPTTYYSDLGARLMTTCIDTNDYTDFLWVMPRSVHTLNYDQIQLRLDNTTICGSNFLVIGINISFWLPNEFLTYFLNESSVISKMSN